VDGAAAVLGFLRDYFGCRAATQTIKNDEGLCVRWNERLATPVDAAGFILLVIKRMQYELFKLLGAVHCCASDHPGWECVSWRKLYAQWSVRVDASPGLPH
jgi:hypothetical protein